MRSRTNITGKVCVRQKMQDAEYTADCRLSYDVPAPRRAMRRLVVICG